MPIRSGEHYQIETFQEFQSRLGFDVRDWFKHAPEIDPDDALRVINEVRADQDEDKIGALAAAHDEELEHYVEANSLPHHPNQTLLETLKNDHREWMHLYDGTIHDIVELHPQDTNNGIDLHDRIESIGRLSLDHRYNVIRDIIHWRTEEHRDRSREINYTSKVASLAELESTELLQYWAETVGKWVLSRSDFVAPCTLNREEWLIAQLGKLIDGQETDYGFVVSVTVDRETVKDHTPGNSPHFEQSA